MFDLRVWRAPWAQRRCFLATKQITPQPRCKEIERDLAHLAAGTSAAEHASVMRGLMVDLRGILVKVGAFAIAGRLALLAAVLTSSRIFETFAGLGQALLISFGYLAFQLAGAYFTSASDNWRGKLAAAAELYLTTRINRKLLQLDPQSMGGFTMGNLKTLISSDVRYFGEFVSSLAWNVTPAVASVVILGPVVYVLAGVPGIVGVLAAFGNIPIAIAFSKKMRLATAEQQVYLDRVATIVGEWLRNVRLSRYLGWQPAFEADIASNVRLYVRAFVTRHLIACVTFGISFAWWMVPVVAMLLTSELMDYRLDLMGFFATLWVIKDLSEYLQHLPHTINLLSTASACLQRITRLEKSPELEGRLSDGLTVVPAEDAVPVALELRNVTFAYEAAQPVLSGIDARFDLRQRTAIVGEVGAGKTTLLRLIAGELAPNAGEILVHFSDGTAAPLWSRRIYARYRAAVGYVPQEPFISNDTLAANIALEPGDAGPQHIEAAYLAELEADVALLAKGYQEPIGETGINLSGGQKQRLNLARAFYSRRRIQLLDDPLSAVDVRTEAKLMAGLVRVSDGFVLVSHRLGELQRCDRILMLESGRIVEDDKPNALLADQGSRYSAFVRANADA